MEIAVVKGAILVREILIEDMFEVKEHNGELKVFDKYGNLYKSRGIGILERLDVKSDFKAGTTIRNSELYHKFMVAKEVIVLKEWLKCKGEEI